MARKTRVSCCIALAVALLAGDANAADLSTASKDAPVEAKASDPLIGFSFYSRYASDYNFRGVSNSNLQPSYQTGFEVQYFNNFFYTAFATYQTRLPTQPDFEFDLIAGIRPTFGKLALDIGILYYFYPNERRLLNAALVPMTGGTVTPGYLLSTANSDFYEGALKATYPITDELLLGANVYASPSFFGTHAASTYVSGTAAYTLPATWFSFLPEKYAAGFSVSAEFGHFFLGAAKSSATGPFNPATGQFAVLNLPSYFYGNVGASYTYKNLLLDIRFHDTDLTPSQCFTFTGDYRGFVNGGTSRWCGSAIIGSITWQASTAAPGVYAEPSGILDFLK